MGNDKTRPDCKDNKGIIGMLHHRALSSAVFCIKKTCLQLSSLFYYLDKETEDVFSLSDIVTFFLGL